MSANPSSVALALVLLYAALQRVCYLVVYPEVMPFFAHPLADARVYEAWSSAIAAGDFWSRGEGVFYRAPLYPYLLAATRLVCGHAMPFGALVQALLGMGVLCLTARVGARVAGPWAGVCAAGLLALYGPLLAFETKRLPTTLGLFLHVGSLLLVLRMAERPSPLRGISAGLSLGLSALVRPPWILLAPVLVWLLAPKRSRRSFFRTTGSWFLCAALLVVGSSAVRNRVIGGEWVAVSSNGGMTFYQGNNPENRSGLLAVAPEVGLMGEALGQRDAELRLAEQISGRALGAGGANRFWLRRGLDFIVEQPGPWLRLEGRKLALLIRNFEYPDNYSFFAERARVWPLWLAPLPFGILLTLGVLGASLAPRSSALRVVLGSAVWGLGACLLFYVSSRYRVDAVPALAILGGVTLARGLRLSPRLPTEERNTPTRGLVMAPAAGLVCVLSFWPVDAAVRSQESMATLQLAVAFDKNGQPEAAEAAFAQATAQYPGNTFAWRRRLEWVARRQTPSAALSLFQDIPATIRPTPELQHIRGILLEGVGDLDEAEAAYRGALENGMEVPEAAARLAGLRARAGAFAEAESLLAFATRTSTAPAAAWIALADVRLALRDFPGAEAAAAAALAREPSNRHASILVAKCRLDLGDPDGALRALLASGTAAEAEETLARLAEEIGSAETDSSIHSP